jgi:hypothetical protein
MADVIKRVVVENVPKVYKSGYTLRYRVVSEDRNRVSHWSPIHTFEKDEVLDPVGGEILFISERQISASWEETNANSVYEIFINWNDEIDGDSNLVWTYARTVSSPTYTVLAPVGAESVSIWVQQPTTTKQYTEDAEVFTQRAENTFTS